MPRSISCLFLAATLVLMTVASGLAQEVNLAGPWILDFPQGKGTVILQNAGGTPPKYSGLVTIPHPGDPKSAYTFHVTLHSDPSYVKAGNNITFMPQSTPGIQFFMMNVSSGSSGIAWVIPSVGADNNMLKAYYGVKAPAHR